MFTLMLVVLIMLDKIDADFGVFMIFFTALMDLFLFVMIGAAWGA